MARSIIIVNATQVVKTENNPQGALSVVSGFPKNFDSGANGDVEQNMRNAKAAYYAQLSANYANANVNRVMMTVTLTLVDGRQLLHECIGSLPAEEAPAEPAAEPEE